jgi:drug/metabolite transporter (DMT)-like permease
VAGDLAVGDLTSLKPLAPRSYALIAGVVVLTMFLWASGFVVVRYIRPYYGAGEIVFARFFGAGLVLSIPLAFERPSRPSRSDAAAIFVVGVMWLGLNNFMLNAGEKLIDAGTAAMLANVSPVCVAVAAALVLRERVGRPIIVGLAVALAGAIVIGWSSGHHHGGLGGAALCLFSAIPFTIAVVAQKPVLARVSPTTATWGACMACALVFIPFAPDLVHEVSHAPANYTLLLGYLILGPSAVAFATWAFALTHSGLAAQTVGTYLVPLFAVLLGWLALGETPAALAVLGGALCLAGVTIAQRSRQAIRDDRTRR